MKRLAALSLALTFIASMLLTSSAIAAPKAKAPGGGGPTTSSPLGIDISWPQCGKRLPESPAFVVVGVNGGLATTTNPCLKDQLIYAKNKATGTIASQPKIQLYVNTANPGGLGTDSWPKNNIDPAQNTTFNPYGTCDNSDSLACAYQYGWNRAVEDVINRFNPAAQQAGVDQIAKNYLWWLDVELDNTWKEGQTTFDYTSNTAVLEGMTEYFNSIGAEVGLYATGYQWGIITGNAITSGSNLNGLKNWRPGGANLATAKDACKATPLTAGGTVIMTQYVSKGIDYNYTC